MIVHACLRDGAGGSPTAIIEESPLTDAERRAIPVAACTSHAVFVHRTSRSSVRLRFFTSEGELPACGHGTVAALAMLGRDDDHAQFQVQAGGRTFAGTSMRVNGELVASFDPGPVTLTAAVDSDIAAILDAIGVEPADANCCIASVGRRRLLVEIGDRAALAPINPDLAGLRAACDRLGLLGCYVYATPTPDNRTAARMFAPSIGVPEDIANANSTACLAAHLADRAGRASRSGSRELLVDMGDSLGQPATVRASVTPGPGGPRVLVGGAARMIDDYTP
jgi:PhzF family phenazine biosynthesis protein